MSAGRRTPLVDDPALALALGVLAGVASIILLYDAFEGRGRDRPFALRLLPFG